MESLGPLGSAGPSRDDVPRLPPEEFEAAVRLRRDLHRHPELAFEEHRTAERIAEELEAAGVDEIRTQVGGTGVVGVIRGNASGRATALLRADMDALPIAEADRGQPYRSAVEGVSHACGHDGHVASLVAAARVLARERDRLGGAVVLAFQPAEEPGGGAARMIADGLLDDPLPQVSLALHLWNDLPVGRVDVREGPVYAATDVLRLRIAGRGGHGAEPHLTADTILAAAYVLTELQSVVSRSTPPFEPAVLSIGSIHGGAAQNVIPTGVEMLGSLRTFSEEVRARLLERVRRLVEGVAAAHELTGTVEHLDACPPCVNDPGVTEAVRAAACAVVGEEHVGAAIRSTGADDMARVLERVPGCYFRVGSANAARGLDASHHTPEFDFDERAIDTAATVTALATMRLLGPGRDRGGTAA